ncbi:MAG: prepilin peptidase [Candidatus Pacebacteria bacterium]|nr:prepilin peptidase [Candidatus Paceibacterota bacterium]
MLLVFSLIIFCFGAIIGSFLNCLAYRLKAGKSFLLGRSFCPHCRHQLGCLDLIPIVSFFLLLRKCRYCRQEISWQYPLVEVTTGLLFLFIFNFYFFGFNYQNIIHFVYLLVIASLLEVIFIYDFKYSLIPNLVVYSAIATVFLYRIFEALVSGLWPGFVAALAAAILAGGLFFLIWLVSKGQWMGFGDVKLAFFMGIFLSWPAVLTALFFAFLIGAIIGLILMVAKKKGLKSEVPFGPFLVIGTFVAFIWGEAILSWYLHFLS